MFRRLGQLHRPTRKTCSTASSYSQCKGSIIDTDRSLQFTKCFFNLPRRDLFGPEPMEGSDPNPEEFWGRSILWVVRDRSGVVHGASGWIFQYVTCLSLGSLGLVFSGMLHSWKTQLSSLATLQTDRWLSTTRDGQRCRHTKTPARHGAPGRGFGGWLVFGPPKYPKRG